MSITIQLRLRNKYGFDEVGTCLLCLLSSHTLLSYSPCLFPFLSPLQVALPMDLFNKAWISSCLLRGLTIVFWFLLPPVASKSQLLFLLYSQLSLPTSYVLASIATHNCGMSTICIVLPCANSRREEVPSVSPLLSCTVMSPLNCWAQKVSKTLQLYKCKIIKSFPRGMS